MNILPKKSWHVRNKDNVEKVRKDEENARLEEKEQHRRAALAEQEARTNYLRDKARTRALESSDDLKELFGSKNAGTSGNSLAVLPSGKKVDLSSHMKNDEHEKEKKQEQEKYEKKVGILTYLGQSAAETMDDCEKPWYFKIPERRKEKGDHASSDDNDDHGEKDLKRKASLDPMEAMKSHLSKKKLSDEHKKKHKKQKRKHHRHHSAEKGVAPTKNDKLSKLREERLKREQKERLKTMALLNDGQTVSTEEISGRYNSQFNPHLVRPKHYPSSRR